MRHPPGLFLSLDGIDGCGKSTQCQLLGHWLRELGHSVVLCHDPGGTPLGDQLRAILLQSRGAMELTAEMFLFMASRAQLMHDIIRPALEAGNIVLSDRFLLANVVYQGHAGGLDPAQLWQIGQLATCQREPDLTLVLDLPVEQAQTRRGRPADRMESRPTDYHQRVRDGFLLEAARRPALIHVMDATGTTEQVQAQIRKEVKRVLELDSRA